MGESRGRRSESGRRRRRKKGGIAWGRVIILLLIIAGLVTGIVFGIKAIIKGIKGSDEETQIETLEPESELEAKVTVDGINITGKGKSEARIALEKKYRWDMTAVYAAGSETTYDIPNLLEKSINDVLDEIYDGMSPNSEYTLVPVLDEELLEQAVAEMKTLWNVEPKNGSISGYDKNTNTLTYSGGVNGTVINEEKLKSDIRAAFAEAKYTTSITVSADEVAPEMDEDEARARYTTIGKFTTNSTANADRNNNLNLACKAINGIVLQVGDEFSFNKATGNRTAEAGYKEAAAYQNGEVVQEAGGGVCQVASTLYNAVIFSGLNVTERHAHTYAPTYVTPGEDATVSYDGYDGPDLRFTNTSSAALVIRAEYYDRTVTCWLIGIPILPEGETVSMHSEKVAEMDVPAPVYEEDPTMAPHTEQQVSEGDKGSRWTTNIIHKVNGEVVSNEFFHTSTYNGHKPKVKRNSTDRQVNAAGEVVLQVETDASGAVVNTTYGPGYTGSAAESTPESSGDANIPAGPGVPAGPGAPTGPGAGTTASDKTQPASSQSQQGPGAPPTEPQAPTQERPGTAPATEPAVVPTAPTAPGNDPAPMNNAPGF